MKTLGIIGGGQLGRMICFEAHKMGFKTVVLTDQIDSPASFVTNSCIVGDYLDEKILQKFCNSVDFATFEFENIPLHTAEFIEKKLPLYPNSNVLKITQNRILEKKFLNDCDIKTAEFKIIENYQDIVKGLEIFKKAILKTAVMGYDGKGQFVLNADDDFSQNYQKLKDSPLILEKFCKFESEASVIVARSQSGEIKTYEPLTNIHKNAILERSIFPSQLSTPQKLKAKKIAEKIANNINLIGIMAVEFFILDNKIIVNELAPRPHNSGHFSMDASITSQFQQLIRAITGMALGETRFHSQGQMLNLIGDDINLVNNYAKNPKAKIHLYGKDTVKAGRKMGHINILK